MPRSTEPSPVLLLPYYRRVGVEDLICFATAGKNGFYPTDGHTSSVKRPEECEMEFRIFHCCRTHRFTERSPIPPTAEGSDQFKCALHS